MNQYNFQWACARCGEYHNWWVDSSDLKTLMFRCVACSYQNQVKYKIYESESHVKCDVKPYYFPAMKLNEFVSILPYKPSKEKLEKASKEHNIPVDEALNLWCVHDAIHFIGGYSFSLDGEQRVRYVEEQFNVGWWALNPKYNTHTPKPCNTAMFNHSRIAEVATQIKEILC